MDRKGYCVNKRHMGKVLKSVSVGVS
jgi:hypothetical protein